MPFAERKQKSTIILLRPLNECVVVFHFLFLFFINFGFVLTVFVLIYTLSVVEQKKPFMHKYNIVKIRQVEVKILNPSNMETILDLFFSYLFYLGRSGRRSFKRYWIVIVLDKYSSLSLYPLSNRIQKRVQTKSKKIDTFFRCSSSLRTSSQVASLLKITYNIL